MKKKDCKMMGESLSAVLANMYAIYLKTQNFHWNITGSEFYSLHLLLEKQYQDLAEAIDELAERIRALGVYVDASFSAFGKLSLVPDTKKPKDQQAMIQELIASHEIFICEARKALEVAETVKDAASIDLLSRRLGVHEKFTWMLDCQVNF